MGFCTLEPDVHMSYKVSNVYAPNFNGQSAGTTLAIDWQLRGWTDPVRQRMPSPRPSPISPTSSDWQNSASLVAMALSRLSA